MLKTVSNIEIILCDINMPGMSGLELLEQIKSLPLMLKTIMVTAYGNMENIRAAMNGGAFDFVTKPIKFADLDQTIQKGIDELKVLKAGEEAQRQLPLTQQALELSDQKARQLEELDQLKSRFFTNISHEFRTPLTVIRGMSHHIVKEPAEWVEKGSQIIQRNTDQLLDLVNQILDLRKLEAGKLALRLEQIEVLSFLRFLSESFQQLAASKQLRLEIEAPATELWMDVDSEKLQRIHTNLLSNAIKFTPAGGEIVVKLQVSSQEATEHLLLSISDTGVGIPESQLPSIFDRFYQVDDSHTREQEGTGIGLALTQELVHLMKGKIEVESRVQEGTTFRVVLPIHQNSPKAHKEIKPLVPEYLITNNKEAIPQRRSNPGKELPLLLLIEDNADVVEYLVASLRDQYQLLIARDGEEGIEIALEQVPDLIISDVMMPKKDGFEVCKTLKEDERTSHIPIVLLTAKSDDVSRMDGLSSGADAYLPKPFNETELFIRLDKLLDLRRRLQRRYQGTPATDQTEESTAEQYKREDAFLEKIREIVDANLSESYNIPALCKLLGLSRSNLHRKVKALTGNSISIYIRSIRLEKARGILKAGKLSIAEIAYEVGFNDPGYFTRSFTQEFGISPKEFREQEP